MALKPQMTPYMVAYYVIRLSLLRVSEVFQIKELAQVSERAG